MKDYKQLLEKPFPFKSIQWRVGSTSRDKTKGIALAYIDSRAVSERLDEVFGIDGWQTALREIPKGGVICTLECKFVNDDGSVTWVQKEDGSDFTDIESIKGGISGAFKRVAASGYGIGRYLYDLPNIWCPLKDGKYLADTPKLPEWALIDEEKHLAGENKPSYVSQETSTTPPVDSNGKHIIKGNKHNGEFLEDVVHTDRGYVTWVSNKDGHEYQEIAKKLLSETV